ncbi:MAG TPA: 6-carboxytetrahydropterin synthase [Candidatus Dormibacteraeota bacterium]
MALAKTRVRTEADRSAAARAVTVVRRATFAAAHVLRVEDWDEERNRAVFGRCVGDHGHNYVLEVAVEGVPAADTGMVVNLRELDRVMHVAVIDDVDHRHLNRDVDWLEGVIPTAENLALAFWRRLEAALPEGALRRVRLTESENNSVEVSR